MKTQLEEHTRLMNIAHMLNNGRLTGDELRVLQAALEDHAKNYGTTWRAGVEESLHELRRSYARLSVEQHNAPQSIRPEFDLALARIWDAMAQLKVMLLVPESLPYTTEEA